MFVVVLFWSFCVFSLHFILKQWFPNFSVWLSTFQKRNSSCSLLKKLMLPIKQSKHGHDDNTNNRWFTILKCLFEVSMVCKVLYNVFFNSPIHIQCFPATLLYIYNLMHIGLPGAVGLQHITGDEEQPPILWRLLDHSKSCPPEQPQ